MLLWHAWQNDEANALNEVIDRFRAIHPDVTVQERTFATPAEMRAEFETAARSGLGPDLFVAPSSWVRTLADADLISAINFQLEDSATERYTPVALETVRYQDRLYGLPAAINVMALFYRTGLVEQPATTLDALLAEAAQGRIVALPTSFFDAFWGVAAFGGRLVDEEGRVVLDRGGFANWLDWLKNAREAPGMILDSNREVLRNRFVDDGVAYYAGYAAEYNALVDALGAEAIGVAPLPNGPTGSAGPLLTTQALLFSAVSSANQRQLALELATFITNAEQEATLMRSGRLVPANGRVRVNSRLNPDIANFVAQARSAIPVTNSPLLDEVFTNGADAYTKALEGVLESTEAAYEITSTINEINGFDPSDAPQFGCQGVGTIDFVHTLAGVAAEAFDELLQRFRAQCPILIIRSEQVEPDDLVARLSAAKQGGSGIDLVLAPQSALRDLLAAGLVADLTPYVDNETLQRYRPEAVSALRWQNGLYGLPVGLDLNALYFNRSLVPNPAQTLADLRGQAEQGAPIQLDVRFGQAFWGVGAMGGRLYDDDGKVFIDQPAFTEWLTWLSAAQSEANLLTTRASDELLANFIAGRSAYLIGGAEHLPALQAQMSTDAFGLAVLPAGPNGDATPLYRVRTFLLPRTVSEQQARLALEFVAFATNAENQNQWMERVSQLPANANVDVNQLPALATFSEQLRTAQRTDNGPEMAALLARGDQLYRAVLNDDVAPAAAVEQFVQTVNAALAGESDR